MLVIHFFGTVRLAHSGQPAPPHVSHIVQALLAYLVLHRNRTHSRDVLCTLLWGEHSEIKARHCLNTALWRVRQILEPPGVTKGAYLTTTRTGEVGFDQNSDHWLDVANFEEQANRVARGGATNSVIADVGALERALALYTGDLLEPFYYDWALRERERLRMLYLVALARLMQHHSAAGELDDALACGRRILELDPLREDVHRDLMRLYVKSGRRALAIQQYETCQAILERELDIAPMVETRALHTEIVSAARREGPGKDPPTPHGHDALLPMRLALQGIEGARRELMRAIRAVEGAFPPR